MEFNCKARMGDYFAFRKLETPISEGAKGSASGTPGDLLVHFAGVYDTKKMQSLVADIHNGGQPRINFFPNETT